MKQKHMLIFMIKSLKNHMFLEHFIDKMKRKMAVSDRRILKKRTLEDTDSIDKTVNPCVDDKRLKVDEELTIQSEIQAKESGSCSSQEHKAETSISETNSFDVGSEKFVLWEKLMEDDMIYDEDQDVAKKQEFDIVLEFESLIAKPPECGLNTRGMVDVVGCPVSTAQ
ncbi:hypothetical protein CDL12_27736 [Handroanthus impetiginosus]|uniref:Uncharacterized protein n=1 Tax=Handroanthus impetiginosus TaxID=429701 RepID=A0A2G9G375_9LAMI|nr:hypothetical protein CDL12_27736 [Handroanthus impetiginosus]